MKPEHRISPPGTPCKKNYVKMHENKQYVPDALFERAPCGLAKFGPDGFFGLAHDYQPDKNTWPLNLHRNKGMSGDHLYNIELEWTGNQGTGTSAYRAYSRDHTVSVDGKPTIAGSSDPAFLGDASRYNPEDMFLASIASCHMLWFLHLASAAGIVVTAYRDRASGVMKTNPNGSGEFSSVTLSPVVSITELAHVERARALHSKVGDMCFIARSVKVPIYHEATVTVEP